MLVGHLEMLCTALVMEIEEYVRSFNASRALPVLMEISNAHNDNNGDCVVMSLRAIALVLEHVPNSNEAADALAGQLFAAAAGALRRAKTLHFEQSPPLAAVEEALRIIGFLARDDISGKALASCPSLCREIIRAAEWGDPRTLKLCLETFSVICSKINFSEQEAHAARRGGAAESASSQAASRPADSTLVRVVAAELLPFLHNSIHAGIAIFATGDGSDWAHIERAVQCLVFLVERISLTFAAGLTANLHMWRQATSPASAATNQQSTGPVPSSTSSGNSRRKLSFSNLFSRSDAKRSATESPPVEQLVHPIDTAVPADIVRAIFAGLQTAAGVAAATEVKAQRQLLLLSGLTRIALQRRDVVLSQLSSPEAVAFFSRMLHAERVDALSLLDDPFRSQMTSTVGGGSTSQPRGSSSASRASASSIPSVEATPSFATLWLLHACFPVVTSTPTSSRQFLVAIHVWEWEDDLHAYTRYGDDQCVLLDACLIRKQLQVQVRLSGGRTYLLDLVNLKQSRGGGVGRNIQRSFAPVAFAFCSDDVFARAGSLPQSDRDDTGSFDAESDAAGPVPIPPLEGLPSDSSLLALKVLLGSIAAFAASSSILPLKKLASLVVLQVLQANLPPSDQNQFALVMIASAATATPVSTLPQSSLGSLSLLTNAQLVCEYIVDSLVAVETSDILENVLLSLDWLVHGPSGASTLVGRQASNSSFGSGEANASSRSAAASSFSFVEMILRHGVLMTLDTTISRLSSEHPQQLSATRSRSPITLSGEASPPGSATASYLLQRALFLRQVLAETAESPDQLRAQKRGKASAQRSLDDPTAQFEEALAKISSFGASQEDTPSSLSEEKDEGKDKAQHVDADEVDLQRSVASALLDEFLSALQASASTVTSFQWTKLDVSKKLLRFISVVGAPMIAEVFAAEKYCRPVKLLIEKVIAALPNVISGLPLVESVLSTQPVSCRGVRESLALLSAISPQMQLCSAKPTLANSSPNSTPERGSPSALQHHVDASEPPPHPPVVDLRQYCPSGHRLRPMRMASSWSCDVCHASFSPSGSTDAQSCRTCNFDLCSDCYMNDAIGYEGGEPVAEESFTSRLLHHHQHSAQLPFVVRRGGAREGLEESRIGGTRVHILASIGDLEAHFRVAGGDNSASVSSSLSRHLARFHEHHHAQRHHLSRRLEDVLTRMADGADPGQAGSQSDVRQLVRRHLQLEEHARQSQRDADQRRHHLSSNEASTSSSTATRQARLREHERLELFYEGVGRCQYQETIFSMLFRKAVAKRLLPVLEQFESCITVLDKSHSVPSDDAGAAPSSSSANEGSSTPDRPVRPDPVAFGTRQHHALPAESPLRSPSSSTLQDSSFGGTPTRPSARLQSVREFADASVTRSRVFYVHSFSDRSAERCTCAEHSRDEFSADSNSMMGPMSAAMQSPLLRPSRLEGSSELALLQILIEVTRRPAKAHNPKNRDSHFDDDRSFESSEVTQLVLRSVAASALRVALLPPCNALPRWVRFVLASCPFLVPLRVRSRIAAFMSGGARRSLWSFIRDANLRDFGLGVEVTPSEWTTGAQQTTSSQTRLPSSENSPGRSGDVHKHTVRRGPSFLVDALGLLASSLSHRHPLAVSFVGDNGTGSGPTIQFYTMLARELCAARFAALWRGGLQSVEAAQHRVHHIPIPANGLYPAHVGQGGCNGRRTSQKIPDVRNPSDFQEDERSSKTSSSAGEAAPTTAVERQLILSAMQSESDEDFLHILMPTSPEPSTGSFATLQHSDRGDRATPLLPQQAPPSNNMDATAQQQEHANTVFYMIGAAIGRCFLDQQIFPLPLSDLVVELLLLGCPSSSSTTSTVTRKCVESFNLDLADLFLVDPALSKIFSLLKKKRSEFVNLSTTDERRSELASEVEAMDLVFTVPGNDERELTANGSNTPVTLENVKQYLRRCCDDILMESVAEQLWNMHCGFTDTVPTMLLGLLSPREFSRIVLGDSDDHDDTNDINLDDDPLNIDQMKEVDGPPSRKKRLWTAEEFLSVVVADHGYTKECLQVQWFAQIVSEELDRSNQRKFLEFCTGCPRLPFGGITALGKITIVRRDEDMSAAGSRNGSVTDQQQWGLVTVNTCFRYLKLPPYPSLEIMRHKVLLSIRESGDKFELS